MSKKLERLRQERQKAETQLRKARNDEKALQRELSRLTRAERTRRLCTRGTMLERFLPRSKVLTDEDVMDILKQAFSKTGARKKIIGSISRQKTALYEGIILQL